jgi:hypothetical protein
LRLIQGVWAALAIPGMILDDDLPRVLTWHVHGSYLFYLTHAACRFYLPVREDRVDGYGGKVPGYAWGPNVAEVPADQVRDLELDCVLYQAPHHYETERNSLLSEAQRRLPYAYLEHDPPRQRPTTTHHIVDDPAAVIVHCTHFNRLMWDNNRTPTVVIEHGAGVPGDAVYTGELAKGIVVINNLKGRGRRLGSDVFLQARREIPLDLVGMNAAELGGLGEVPLNDLPYFVSRYRFFFNPIRYTSLGLAVVEAMLVGLPVVGLATTELATVIENDRNGYVDTNPEALIARMQLLLDDPERAARLGQGARETARTRFNLRRFAADWEALFGQLKARRQPADGTRPGP